MAEKGNTREKILFAALKLFARDGYEAVSVRDIGREVSLSPAALYKHFANKRGILDAILERMAQNDARRARDFEVPEKAFVQDRASYAATLPEKLISYTRAQYTYWTEDEFASVFRRMLTLEQYKNPEMARLFGQYLSGGVLGYLEDLFREMPLSPEKDSPRQQALSFYAPVYFLIALSDEAADRARLRADLDSHLERFFYNLKEGNTDELD